MLLQYALAFLSGILVKSVDWLDDVKKSKSPARFVLAIAYGLLLGYVIGTSSFSAIFIAAIAGQILARKVDTAAHRLGVAIAALSLILFGFPTFDVWLFLVFLFLAFMDEMDYVGRLRPLNTFRPFLKAGALIPALLGVWDYFIGIIAFDAGYELFRLAVREKDEERENEL